MEYDMEMLIKIHLNKKQFKAVEWKDWTRQSYSFTVLLHQNKEKYILPLIGAVF
jgi:hypothetical protein